MQLSNSKFAEPFPSIQKYSNIFQLNSTYSQPIFFITRIFRNRAKKETIALDALTEKNGVFQPYSDDNNNDAGIKLEKPVVDLSNHEWGSICSEWANPSLFQVFIFLSRFIAIDIFTMLKLSNDKKQDIRGKSMHHFMTRSFRDSPMPSKNRLIAFLKKPSLSRDWNRHCSLAT